MRKIILFLIGTSFSSIKVFQAEIGLTYDELSIMGRLRRPGGCDPYSMFVELATEWHPDRSYDEVMRYGDAA